MSGWWGLGTRLVACAYKSSPGYAEPGPSPSMRETAVMQTTAPPKSYDFARDALRVTVPSLD